VSWQVQAKHVFFFFFYRNRLMVTSSHARKKIITLYVSLFSSCLELRLKYRFIIIIFLLNHFHILILKINFKI
jgi:hypothetical protein